MLEWLEKHQLPCFYHQVLGFECPVCGFQSSLLLLLQGDLPGSLKAYPALIPSLIILVLLVSWFFTNKPGWTIMKRLLQLDLAIILISWIVRLII